MKPKLILFALCAVAMAALTLAAIRDETGTTRYRNGAVLSFDTTITIKDEDGNWTMNNASLKALAAGQVWANNPALPGVYVPSYGSTNLLLFGFGNGNIAVDDVNFESGAGNSYCFALGPSTLATLTNAAGTIAMGNGALQFAYSLGGADNADVAIGYNAAQSLTSGQRNVFIGADAATSFGEGSRNTVIGCKAAWTGFSTNDDITSIGYLSLSGIGKVSGLTAVGSQALVNNWHGIENTALGFKAGQTITEGSTNTLVGYQADASASVSNAIVIGDRITATSNNRVMFGNANNDFNVGVAGVGIASANAGFLVHSNTLASLPTLVSGDNFYWSSNGVAYVICSGPTGTLTTNKLGP